MKTELDFNHHYSTGKRRNYVVGKQIDRSIKRCGKSVYHAGAGTGHTACISS